MPTIRALLVRKGTNIVSVRPDTTVLDAATLMNECGIGGVLVMDQGQLAGIFSERDVMRRVVAARRDPASTLVGDVMTSNVITTTADAKIADCRALMTVRRIRHLPVLGEGGIVGVITTGDILAFEVSLQESQINELQKYVFDTR